jgi:hypothetical protein
MNPADEDRIIFTIGCEIATLIANFGPITSAPEELRARICVQYLMWMANRGQNSGKIVAALLDFLYITPYTLNKYFIDEHGDTCTNLGIIADEFPFIVPPISTLDMHKRGYRASTDAMTLTLLCAVFECRSFGDDKVSVNIWALTRKKASAYSVAKYWQNINHVDSVYEMILALSASDCAFN